MTTETERRECKSCKGSGTHVHEAFEYEGRSHPRRVTRCSSCEGRGWFAPPNVDAILAAIKGRKGLRSARPKDDRAYYVWRLARFHGGADVTMPVMAGLAVHGDPYVAELDKIADAVAKRVFGTDLAAAHRWGRALGHLDRDMSGLPDSAYEGGRRG